MAEILLVNPRKRRRKSVRRRKTARRTYAANPRKRRRKHRNWGKVSAHSRRTNPRRRRRSVITRGVRRRRRRNPSLRGVSGKIMPTLKSGLIGATGALGLDFLWGQGSKYLPATIAASPIAQYATKLAGAILVGIVGGKLWRGKGRDLAVGATTVVLHDALKAQLNTSFPQLGLGEYLTFAPTVGHMNRAGRLMSTGMGEYLSGLPEQNGTYHSDDMGYSADYSSDSLNGY